MRVFQGVEVRGAGTADIPELCELLGLLFAKETEFTPDAERQTRGLRLILENPYYGRIYCAVDNGRVIGMVSTLFTVSTAEGGRAVWLEDFIVRPEWRGKGVGRLLLEVATRAAKAEGCGRVTLLTDPTNTRAIRFYARAGFSHSEMRPFRLRL
jgi:GNAT superfamily N-acetyltransferase